MEAALERSLKRFDERLASAYDRFVGSEPVSLEDRGKEYLTIAGDPVALKGWYDSQKQIHGAPVARTMFTEMVKEGEKFVDDLISNAKDVTNGAV